MGSSSRSRWHARNPLRCVRASPKLPMLNAPRDTEKEDIARVEEILSAAAARHPEQLRPAEWCTDSAVSVSL